MALGMQSYTSRSVRDLGAHLRTPEKAWPSRQLAALLSFEPLGAHMPNVLCDILATVGHQADLC